MVKDWQEPLLCLLSRSMYSGWCLSTLSSSWSLVSWPVMCWWYESIRFLEEWTISEAVCPQILTSLFLSSFLPVSHWSFLSGWTGLWRLCKCTAKHDGHFYSFGWVGILWCWKLRIIMLYLVTDQSFTLRRPHHHHTGVHPPGWSSHHLPCIQKWTVCVALALLWLCNCLKFEVLWGHTGT